MKSFSDYFSKNTENSENVNLNEAKNLITDDEFRSVAISVFPKYKTYEKMADDEKHYEDNFKCPFSKNDVKKFYTRLADFAAEKEDVDIDRISFESMEDSAKNLKDLLSKIDKCSYPNDLFAFIFDRVLKYSTLTTK